MTADSLLYVPGSATLPPAHEVGGKGHHLARLQTLAAEHGFAVPAFVVLRVEAFARFAPAWTPGSDDPEAWAQAVRSSPCPEPIGAALAAALAVLPPDGRWAVRSSAIGEDSAGRSFAGQFTTVLGVRASREEVAPLWSAVREVWASCATAHALAYAGAQAPRIAMAVVIQSMVDAEASGVVFTRDPVTGARDTIVVSAVYGLGEGLVSGALDADTWTLEWRDQEAHVTRRALAHKDQALRLDRTGTTHLQPVPSELRDSASLQDHELFELARCARAIEASSGLAQDIEWALSAETRQLMILQARPITTTIPHEPAERHVWDNSNIIESYGGITSPLTFSFARSVYEDVYRQFCRLMGTPEPLIASHAGVFANMLGHIHGRVYYDLLNWYRTLALLPGFTWNRAFMEKMMGVREALTEPPPPASSGSRLRDLVNLVHMLVRLVRESRRLKTAVPAFHARLERVLGPLATEDLATWPPERARALYAQLESDLLQHWQTPLVNDFFAMIYFGVLGRLTEKWLPEAPPTLVNDLLCGEGGIISTEPARRVMAMARRVSADAALRAWLLRDVGDRELLATLATEPASAALKRDVEDYLARFGDRCMEELKLETITLREDPTFLLHTLRAYVTGGMLDPDAALERERAIRAAAESFVSARLRGPRAMLYRFVLTRTRRRVRDRENLRFERTRVFGVVRRIFLALGAHLARHGHLAEPRDVFYLTRDEVFTALTPEGAGLDLRDRVHARHAEFERYRRSPAPPDRFESVGPPTGREWQSMATPVAASGDLAGTGCCPGVVRARVRVVHDPRQARDLAGCILVAERTDPGWTVLFPAVSGLLIQRGSLLSHSAIVAREMGIPCVVGVAGLLATIEDGEEVEMDGRTGMVRRLGRPA